MKTINDTSLSYDDLRNDFLTLNPSQDLISIFDVAYQNKLFPNRKEFASEHDYLVDWASRYSSFTLPSQRVDNRNGKAFDEALYQILSDGLAISPKRATQLALSHQTIERAEIIVGNLLEEFVNSEIQTKGWIWCKGETLQSIDFIKVEQGQKPHLLQIKNSTNSENSSSKKVRKNKPYQVDAWNRSEANSVDDGGFRKTRWDKLYKILEYSDDEIEQSKLTDEEFVSFISSCCATNRKLLRKTKATRKSK